jgi:hypothetical protein
MFLSMLSSKSNQGKIKELFSLNKMIKLTQHQSITFSNNNRRTKIKNRHVAMRYYRQQKIAFTS